MPTDITPAERAELRRLHEAADPSPVQCIQEDQPAHRDVVLHFCVLILGVRTLARAADTAQNRADFTLIAAARNALPALLDAADERDALRARLAEVERDRDAHCTALARLGWRINEHGCAVGPVTQT